MTDLNGPIVVVDELITQGNNWIVGANKDGYHLRGLNYGRDFEADYIGDLCAAAAGHQCVRCAAPLQSTKADEIGNIFQHGTFYSEAMGCSFTDQSGIPIRLTIGKHSLENGGLEFCLRSQKAAKANLKSSGLSLKLQSELRRKFAT